MQTRFIVTLVLLVLCVGRPVHATQEYVLPTLFDVAGVEPGDVLNIRAAPTTHAQIIGTLEHNARNIEVVAHDQTGRWAQVNTDERTGWVSSRHLAYQTNVWVAGGLPSSLHCLGTEPFWSLRPKGDTVIFSTPESPDQALSLQTVLATGAFRDPRRALIAHGSDGRLTAVMTPAACSDGMSDRAYGLDITIILEGAQTPELLAGCCSIAPK